MNNAQTTSRLPGKRFWVTALTLSAVVAGSIIMLASRYSIAIDSQENLCLPPYRVWLIDKKATEPKRGDIFAFTSQGLEPIFPNGTTIVKVMEGMPGDKVDVSLDMTMVNGKIVGEGLDIALHHDLDPARFERTGTIQDNSYWFFGKTRDSYDSRYWGSVQGSQIVGKAYPIW